ncbi:MAG TPA: GIY-YIG nuclease family protein [Aeromicrobium sp.]|jgi:putative endonuclease|nr:GIY-YIG nuclease family protein [Aeromicrobium sp.]HKY56934.1 GIY-YIG nuclease family protein [Aeromicrobium sp.]
MAFMYLLECGDGTFYAGSTRNLVARLQQHRRGQGAQYTRSRLPVRLVYFESHDDIGRAFGREKAVQGWTRSKKRRLIEVGPGHRVTEDDGTRLDFLT